MPVPTQITELSQTAGSNGPDGGSVSPALLDDYQRAHASFIAQLRDGKGNSATVSIASATTTDIGAANSLSVEITETNTITSFGTTYSGPRFIRFAGILTLTHGASLSLPGAANITTAAGDTCIAVPNLAANGWALIGYQRASGFPLSGAFAAKGANSDITSLSGLTTALTIAQGGTGAATEGAAFAALKQYATETDSGVVELATDIEAQTGTDSTRVATIASMHGAVMGNLHTWQDMKASRALGTTYFNTTGRPIFVAVGAGSNATHEIVAVSGSTVVSSLLGSATANPQMRSVVFMVPNESGYYVTVSGGTPYLGLWAELR